MLILCETIHSSFSTALTTMRTTLEANAMTRRALVLKNEDGTDDESRLLVQLSAPRWHLYPLASHPQTQLLKKQSYNLAKKEFFDVRMSAAAVGAAIEHAPFAEGAERFAYRFTEVDRDQIPTGQRLVAKEAAYNEDFSSGKFHHASCKMQAEADRLSKLFNERVSAFFDEQQQAKWSINFVPCVIYTVKDQHYNPKNGTSWILAEPELEGKWMKWNNNNGKVLESEKMTALEKQFARCMTDQDEEFHTADIPQCFSHFTWSVTDGQQLVCDLQGVWNNTDGFVLTDPAMHTASLPSRRGSGSMTDKGDKGIGLFFQSHQCSPLCRQLGLKAYPP